MAGSRAVGEPAFWRNEAKRNVPVSWETPHRQSKAFPRIQAMRKVGIFVGIISQPSFCIAAISTVYEPDTIPFRDANSPSPPHSQQRQAGRTRT